MRIAYINPNATAAMTANIVAVARAALPAAQITGLTNTAGPASIQGEADGMAAIPGLLRLIPTVCAAGAEAIVIACFDDTGLAEATKLAPCPVIGIGQASYVMAELLGLRFSVVTSTVASIPVIAQNIKMQGFDSACASVRAVGLPVLEIDEGGEKVRAKLEAEIMRAQEADGAETVVLGCAGMAALAPNLSARTGLLLIDGVAASAHLAQAAIACRAGAPSNL